MPVLNMEVPINTEAYYRGETIARREGVSLYDKFAQWLNEYIEDADDAAALNDMLSTRRPLEKNYARWDASTRHASLTGWTSTSTVARTQG